MQSGIERLAEALRRHTERHERLLALAEEKRQAIIRNDTDRVDAILGEETALLDEVRVVEQERIACAAEIGVGLGIGETPTLDRILEAHPEAAGRIEPLRARLREVLEALRERTRRNENLLHASLLHIRQFFDALAEARTAAPVYTRAGGRSGAQVRLVDQTA